MSLPVKMNVKKTGKNKNPDGVVPPKRGPIFETQKNARVLKVKKMLKRGKMTSNHS